MCLQHVFLDSCVCVAEFFRGLTGGLPQAERLSGRLGFQMPGLTSTSSCSRDFPDSRASWHQASVDLRFTKFSWRESTVGYCQSLEDGQHSFNHFNSSCELVPAGRTETLQALPSNARHPERALHVLGLWQMSLKSSKAGGTSNSFLGRSLDACPGSCCLHTRNAFVSEEFMKVFGKGL